MPRGASGQGCETPASSPRRQRRRTTSSAALPPPAPSLRSPPPAGPSAILQPPWSRGSCGLSGSLLKFSLASFWAQDARRGGRGGPGPPRSSRRRGSDDGSSERLGAAPGKGGGDPPAPRGGGPRWVSGCCVVLAGVSPGRLQPERSGSPGGERAPAAAAAAAHRSVTLETPASPRGPGGGSQPRKERARHSQRGAPTLPRARGRGCGAAARVPRPHSPYLLARQLPITSRLSLRSYDAAPPHRGPALSGLCIRRCGGQVEGGAGAVTGAGFNPVRAAGI